MSELIQPADAEQQATRTRQRWSPRRVSRRGVIRLSAAGLAATMLVTVAASSAFAAPSRPDHAAARNSGSGRVSQPAASKNTSTVSQVATTSAGSLVVTVRYRTGPKLRPTILSVSYSGGAKVHVKQPSLIFAFAPRFPLQVRTQPHSAAYYLKSPRPVRVIFFLVRLKAGQLGHFSGSLSARDLKVLNTVRGLGPIPTVNTTLAHFPHHTRGPVSIRPVLQNGMILLPHLG